MCAVVCHPRNAINITTTRITKHFITDGRRRVHDIRSREGMGCRTVACIGMRGEGAALADGGIFDAARAGAIFTNVANAG